MTRVVSYNSLLRRLCYYKGNKRGGLEAGMEEYEMIGPVGYLTRGESG